MIRPLIHLAMIIPAVEVMSNLFYEIDEFLRGIKHLGSKKAGRTASMSESEVITIVIYSLFLGIKDKKHMWYFMKNYHIQEFPNLPSYKSFNELVNKYSSTAQVILQALMCFNRGNSDGKLKFIDATSIAVCKNKRIFDHKVAEGLAKRGKSSMGWFFGFKLHICIDEDGNLLNCSITPGNTDDRKPVEKLLKDLSGIVVADGGYLSKDLQATLKKGGIDFVTGVRKTMKHLMTKEQHSFLKSRQLVETAFGMMKQGKELVSSLARSVSDHFSRITYSLLAYSLQSLLPKHLKLIS